MPRSHLYIILVALLIYALTAGVALRDRLLVSTLHRIEREAIAEPSAMALFEGAMVGMARVLSEELGDGYSFYIPPNRAATVRDQFDNWYEGLGISVRFHAAVGFYGAEGEGEAAEGEAEQGEAETRELEQREHRFFIAYPQQGSPAYRAGLRSGDQILRIDDTLLTDKTHSEVLRLLRRQTESETLLSVLPFGHTEPQDFSVRRERLQSDSVSGDHFDLDGRVFRLETHPQIGYIWVTSFIGATAREFGDALDSMKQSGVKSLILDLRDNGGGDLVSSAQIARMLLPPEVGTVIATARERNRISRWFLHFIEGSQRCTLPMVVLINGETASSSEILAAALQDHQRATIVGTRSFGKGIIQGYFELPFQSGILTLTDSEFLRPSGAPIHRRRNTTDSDDWGVIPDIIVEISEIEQLAVLGYRLLRSNVISTDRSAVLDTFRQQIIETLNSETGNTEGEPSEQKHFAFPGTAPYYDPQLDEAIRILLEKQE